LRPCWDAAALRVAPSEASSRPGQPGRLFDSDSSRSFLQHGGSVAATDELVLELGLVGDVPLEVELEDPLGIELDEPLGIELDDDPVAEPVVDPLVLVPVPDAAVFSWTSPLAFRQCVAGDTLLVDAAGGEEDVGGDEVDWA